MSKSKELAIFTHKTCPEGAGSSVTLKEVL